MLLSLKWQTGRHHGSIVRGPRATRQARRAGGRLEFSLQAARRLAAGVGTRRDRRL